MAKFKAGDKVKLVREPTPDDWVGIGKVYIKFKIGEPLKVRRASDTTNPWIDLEGYSCSFPANCFDFVTDEAIKQPTTDIVLRCTHNISTGTFTVGKEYKVISVYNDQYTIRDNSGSKKPVPLKGVVWRFEIVTKDSIKKEQSEKELLAYARKHYPIGTKYIPAHINKGINKVTANNHNFSGTYIHVESKYIEETLSNCIYCCGKWAEIVSTPKEESVESKPQFIVGQWYKTKAGSYVKYLETTSGNIFIASEHFMYNNYKVLLGKGTFGSARTMDNFIEIPLEEIQQYLPEGHPDKIIKQSTYQTLPFPNDNDHVKIRVIKDIPAKYIMGVDPVDSKSISDIGMMKFEDEYMKQMSAKPIPYDLWYKDTITNQAAQYYEEKSDILPMQDVILTTKTKTRKRNLL